MTAGDISRPDWASLWRSGALPRFCFISLGLVFHAGTENMVSTIMPAMVRDIGGVELNGWAFAIYEVGSIVAGAAAGRLTTYWPVRANLMIAALVFALGCIATLLSPTMYWALIGRLVSGFGGGAMISLCFIAIQRYFHAAIWPQLMAVESAVWGVSAFTGPLYGATVVTVLSWRWAFGILAIGAVMFAGACMAVLRDEPQGRVADRKLHDFPFFALTCLTLGITAIAAAGVESEAHFTFLLVCAGVTGIAVFFVLDARKASSRLFPSTALDPRTTVGAGILMAAALAMSTCSFGYYGPLLLAALHQFKPLTIGLIIASESVSWSIMAILVSSAPQALEARIIRAGAVMIIAGIAGFAWAVPDGSIAALLFCAMLQGGGFGILWPFASRRVIEAALPSEREITAGGFSAMQRIGYAVGGATAGMIANANGFAGGFTRAAASTAAVPLFVYFLPTALLGCIAAFRLTRPPFREPS